LTLIFTTCCMPFPVNKTVVYRYLCNGKSYNGTLNYCLNVSRHNIRSRVQTQNAVLNVI